MIHAFRVLRVRDFRLLWAGGLVSSAGTWLLTVAVPAQVLRATGSLRDTGLTLGAEYLPQLLLGPVAGVAADRWDRRLVMAASSAASAAAVAVMLLGTAPGRYWVLYIALAAETSTAVFYAPAIQARTPEIVGTGPLLSSASSLTAMTSGVVRLIGGPLGGVLFALAGIRWLICADAASYLIAAAAALMTSRHPSRPETGPETGPDEARARQPVPAAGLGVRASLVTGVRALRRSPVARGLLAVQVLFLAANASLSAVLIPFGIRRLGGSTATGLLMAALGAGFLLGAPVLRIVLDRVQPRHAMAASLAVTAAGYVGLFSSATIATALPTGVVIGMTGAVILATPLATVQRVTASEVLGRVTAAFTTAGAAATLTGAVAGPFAAQAIQLTGAAVVAASVTLAAAALALVLVPRTARPPPPPAGPKSAATPTATKGNSGPEHPAASPHPPLELSRPPSSPR